MSDPIAWWRQHKNSPGMDAQSKSTILAVLENIKAKDFDDITEDMNQSQRHAWDEVFGELYKILCDTIDEIRTSLNSAG